MDPPDGGLVLRTGGRTGTVPLRGCYRFVGRAGADGERLRGVTASVGLQLDDRIGRCALVPRAGDSCFWKISALYGYGTRQSVTE